MESTIGTGDGWDVRARFPDRESMTQIIEYGTTHDIHFTIDRVFETSSFDRIDESRLTDIQRETLLEAADSGYLEIPRECSLEELGERLGVSQSAASQRFRRGVKTLIRETM